MIAPQHAWREPQSHTLHPRQFRGHVFFFVGFPANYKQADLTERPQE